MGLSHFRSSYPVRCHSDVTIQPHGSHIQGLNHEPANNYDYSQQPVPCTEGLNGILYITFIIITKVFKDNVHSKLCSAHCATAVHCYSRQTVPPFYCNRRDRLHDSAVAAAPNTHLKPEAAKAFLSQYYQRRILQYEFHV